MPLLRSEIDAWIVPIVVATLSKRHRIITAALD
jgi:hypothetical protein